MLAGKKVQVRWKRYYAQQRDRVFIGEVVKMSSSWLLVEGRFYHLPKGATIPTHDRDKRTMAIPREAIWAVRVLPDDLDLENLEYAVENDLIVIKLPEGEPDLAVSPDLE